MTTTSFDIAVRTLECSRCGGPIAAPLAGARTTCRYCSAENVIAGRTRRGLTAVGQPSLGDEVARRSRLQAQVDHPLPGNPYDMRAPPPGWGPADATDLQRLRQAWKTAKPSAAGARLPAEQRNLLWLALHLADAEVRARNGLASRAVLETALDLLPDAGHRQMILCRMVVEAVREGDLGAAEAWLAECDPAPEVLDVDGAHREAKAWVARGKRDPHGMLLVLGSTAAEVPTAQGSKLELAALRADALESLGRVPDAYAELRAAWGGKEGIAEHVDDKSAERDALLAQVAADGLAPRTLVHAQQLQLEAMAQLRDRLPRGLGALGLTFLTTPIIALPLLLLVTLPRCFFDADPFLGAHGYVLCPETCTDCSGPFRVYTDWRHNGGEHSTNGPQYFCRTPTNGVATMPDKEMERSLDKLEPYELVLAPAAATYMTLVLLLIPLAVIRASQAHRRSERQAAELHERMGALAARIGTFVPWPVPRKSGFGLGLLVLLGSLLLPLAVIALELALR